MANFGIFPNLLETSNKALSKSEAKVEKKNKQRKKKENIIEKQEKSKRKEQKKYNFFFLQNEKVQQKSTL